MLYGRGAADMKCGLAAILGAVKGLRSARLSPRAPVSIQSVVEEGCTGNGACRRARRLRGCRDHRRAFGAAITTSQVGVYGSDVVVQGCRATAESGSMVSAIESSLP
jgi:acetylornithine deacetylase